MAERVATLGDRAELDAIETWEIELEAEAVTDTPSNESVQQHVLEALGDAANVLEATVDVRTENGRALVAVFVLIAVAVATKHFNQADETADLLRLRIEDYGPIVTQSIRRAA
jgi:hypothetical protein